MFLGPPWWRRWLAVSCSALGLLSGYRMAGGQTAPVHEVIQVRVNSDYPPYEFQGKDGKPTGFDVDVARAAAAATYLDANIECGKWSTIREELEHGQIDLLAGMLYSAERAKRAEFCAPFLAVEYSCFLRNGAPPVDGISDLADRSVLVEDGSLMNDQLKLARVGHILPVASEPEALRKLASGLGDAALVPLLEGLVLIQDDKMDNVEPGGPPLFTRNLCFAATKGNTSLTARMNTGLAIIRANGTYGDIYAKWFGRVSPDLRAGSRLMRVLGFLAAGIAVLFAFGGVWVGTLRRLVRRRTEELNSELRERARIEAELRDSEAKYRNIVDQASDGIYTMDESFAVTEANRAVLEMLGYERDEFIGRTIASLMAPEDVASRPIAKEQMDAGEPVMIERTFVRKDGSRFLAEVSANMIVGGGYQAIIRDITDRKIVEEHLRTMNEDLEQRVVERTAELAAAFNELESFSYSVSHDLRAPLRAMSGYASILLREFSDRLPGEGLGYLERISLNARRMGDLIDDLLSYARLGRQVLRVSTFSMEDLVRSVWSEFWHDRESRDIAVEVQTMPVIDADEKLVRQLMHNLIGNAIKFTGDADHAKVVVGYDPAQCAFFVRDNGVGFDPQYAHKLFQVFERLHHGEFEGTGVGLAIVKRVAERHHGRVWASGALGEGATFWFTLSTSQDRISAAS